MVDHLLLFFWRNFLGVQFLGLQKEAMPVVEATTARVLNLAIRVGQEFGGFKAVGQRDETVAGLTVRQEHGRRMPLPDLERMDKALSLTIMQFQQNLGRFTNPGDGLVGMAVTQQGKVCHGIEPEQVRAGHLEKVGDHVIGDPG